MGNDPIENLIGFGDSNGGQTHQAAPGKKRVERFRRLIVRSVRDETTQCRSLVFDLPDEAGDSFRPEPGQFFTLRTILNGRANIRCYSASSLYAIERTLQITVKRVQGGTVSQWLNESVVAGDAICVAPPTGRFTLRNSGRKAIFFAAGSGITPIFPMLRQVLEIQNRRAALLFWNRSIGDAIFGAELRELARLAAGQLELVQVFGSRAEARNGAVLANFATEHVGSDAYLCGPPEFMARARRVLAARGYPDSSIFEEHFARGVGGAQTPEDSSTAPYDAASFAVVYKNQRYVVAGGSGESILNSMLDAGITVPHGCTEGHCGACVARLTRGSVDMTKGVALSKRDRAQGFILACSAKPLSNDVEISYD